MYTIKKTAGYSFVEVLVAIAILLVSIVGPLTIASTGLRNALFAREQNIAFFLAQEGLEAIIFLRENAGIKNIDNGTDTWDWVSDIPAACRKGAPCRVHLNNVSPSTRLTECDPISRCDLYLHPSGVYRYRHQVGGEETPFNRQVFLTEIGTNALRVRSVVTWHATAFGEAREVELETYLYDIYEN
ncbi:MAG: prepilin-type N-terminal cleavage/methylation domain-containing protein [Candidatus Paceibacterota bacterium]